MAKRMKKKKTGNDNLQMKGVEQYRGMEKQKQKGNQEECRRINIAIFDPAKSPADPGKICTCH